MQIALELAKKAAKLGEVPIGAVLVDTKNDQILAKTFNCKENKKTPLGHAELLALHIGAKKLDRWRLKGCTLYVTLEPCSMCAGALVQARVDRVVYGCMDPKAGACHSLFQIGQDQRLNHCFEISKGVLETDCAEVLKNFFKQRRLANKEKKLLRSTNE